MKLSNCGDCQYIKTCLIPDEHKIWLKSEPIKDTELEMAVEVLRAFNRAGIDYRINTDGSFNFRTEADVERANVISQEIQKKY